MNLKLFRNHGAIYKFEKKFKKYSGEMKSIEIWEGLSLMLILKEQDGMFVYHFVDPDLRVEIFLEKEETEMFF